jgi:hypothetical protein
MTGLGRMLPPRQCNLAALLREIAALPTPIVADGPPARKVRAPELELPAGARRNFLPHPDRGR